MGHLCLTNQSDMPYQDHSNFTILETKGKILVISLNMAFWSNNQGGGQEKSHGHDDGGGGCPEALFWKNSVRKMEKFHSHSLQSLL